MKLPTKICFLAYQEGFCLAKKKLKGSSVPAKNAKKQHSELC